MENSEKSYDLSKSIVDEEKGHVRVPVKMPKLNQDILGEALAFEIFSKIEAKYKEYTFTHTTPVLSEKNEIKEFHFHFKKAKADTS